MSDAPKKRSRFDVGADEPRRSRFDQREPRRRSRSPDDRPNDSHRRSRSPLARATESPKQTDAPKPAVKPAINEKAAAALAKIQADIEAKKKAGLLQTGSTVPKVALRLDSGADKGDGSKDNDIYEQNGDFIKDIEINDLRNRYMLTKGPWHKQITEKTGADVTMRGTYYPDKAMATAAVPPLYLHVTSRTRDGLQAAIDMIEEMMEQSLPNLVDQRRFGVKPPPPDFELDERGRRKWPEEKIPIQLEPINGFNVRAQIVGVGGQYVKHIQSESGGARVQIKGRGSGFIEQDNQESDEPMYLHIAARTQEQVDTAKQLSLDLLKKVQADYDEFKRNGPQRRQGGGGGGYDRGGYGQRDSPRGNDRDSYSYGGGGYGGQQQYGGAGSPMPGQQAQDPYAVSQADMAGLAAWLPYYTWEYNDNAGFNAWMAANPEAATSYAAARPYIMQHAQTLYAQQAPAAPGYGSPAPAQSAAPPPPPGNDAPPPPPPGGNSAYNGGYNAMPPPPGL